MIGSIKTASIPNHKLERSEAMATVAPDADIQFTKQKRWFRKTEYGTSDASAAVPVIVPSIQRTSTTLQTVTSIVAVVTAGCSDRRVSVLVWEREHSPWLKQSHRFNLIIIVPSWILCRKTKHLIKHKRKKKQEKKQLTLTAQARLNPVPREFLTTITSFWQNDNRRT